ncbi:MAG: serine hydrolase [Pseudomonadota bacterium]
MSRAQFGRWAHTLLATAFASLALPAAAQDNTAPVDMSVEEAPDFDGTISTPTDAKRAVERIGAARVITDKALALGFKGEMIVDMGGLVLVNAVSPDLAREGYGSLNAEPVHWPFASVTKQKVAARLVSELDASGLSLDTPISEFVPRMSRFKGPVPTFRQLLQHRSGLRNPNDTPEGENGWPDFYNKPGEYGLDWCMQERSAPPAKRWSYNNCDYIVLGAAFDELSFENWKYMMGQGVLDTGNGSANLVRQVAITTENVQSFYKMASPEAEVLPAFEAAGALGGGLMDIAFGNWALMNDYEKALERGGAKAAFWKGDPELGYMALGHWVFSVQPEQCDAPIIVSQRKGEIGRYQLENIMLPELKRSMVFATAEAGTFEFGEIWAKQGFLYEAVGQLACGDTQ